MMTSPLIKLLNTILHCGTIFSKSPAEKRGIILSNAIGLILFVTATFLSVMYYIWYGWNFVTFAIPVIGLSCLAVIPLNYKGYNDTARIWISLIVPIVTTALSIYSKVLYYDHPGRTRLFYFSICDTGKLRNSMAVVFIKGKKIPDNVFNDWAIAFDGL